MLPLYSRVCDHPYGCDNMLKICVSLILEPTFNKFKNLMAIYQLYTYSEKLKNFGEYNNIISN